MASEPRSARDTELKIVYYGPAASGKTTNLRYIHGRLEPASRGTLLTPTEEGDRTLFFDLLPVELGIWEGRRTRMQLYTVPGQVRHNASRLRVLRGVDGLVFVADSAAARLDDNRHSLQNLRGNLAALGRDAASIPMVLQYNKRDLDDAVPVEELDAALEPEGRPTVEAVAVAGRGVLECLVEVARRVLGTAG